MYFISMKTNEGIWNLEIYVELKQNFLLNSQLARPGRFQRCIVYKYV